MWGLVYRRGPVERLRDELDNAQTWEEYEDIAYQLDAYILDNATDKRALGNDLWRQNPVNRQYDYKLIHSRLQSLIEAQESGDVQGLIYIIRSGLLTWLLLILGLLRNLGNITAKNLYNLGYAGYPTPFSVNVRTKLLIEDYISETTSALLYIFSLPSPNPQSSFPKAPTYKPPVTSAYPTTHHSPTLSRTVTSSSDLSVKSVPANIASATYANPSNLNATLSFQEKKSFFLQSRQTFGSTALVLQGGSVFGLCHVGVVRGLWKRGLLPRIIVGWGVGGLIASLGITRVRD
jgi:TAG lipase/lysophosphatidylethanolamine acyltransferase